MSWQEMAACSGMDTALFYAPDADDGEPGETAVAKKYRERAALLVCRTCSVVDLCLDAAVQASDDWGVQGATTPDDRRYLRRHERPMAPFPLCRSCGRRISPERTRPIRVALAATPDQCRECWQEDRTIRDPRPSRRRDITRLTEDEMRQAHSQYCRGERSAAIVEGERDYQAYIKRRKHSAA